MPKPAAKDTTKTPKPKKTVDTQPKENKVGANLTWLPKKTFELEMTIPKELVAKEYDHVLEHFVKDVEVKGFRKGKAPKNLVEAQVGKSRITEEVIRHLVTKAYWESVSQHKLQPIVAPDIQPVSIKDGEDWVLKAVSCEIPEVKLGEYKEAIKGLKAKGAIWTPDKASKEEEKPQEVSLEHIFDEILKTTTAEVSDILVDSELNRMLTNFVDQVKQVGMTVQQYLDTKGMSNEQLRADYRKAAEQNLKLEFVLYKIADQEKIEVDDKELDQKIDELGDENAKKQLQSPDQKAYFATIVRKQKTVEFLKNL